MMNLCIGVQKLAEWCNSHNLALNIKKTKELTLDFCKSGQYNHTPLNINGEGVEKDTNLKILVLAVTEILGHQHCLSDWESLTVLLFLKETEKANVP